MPPYSRKHLRWTFQVCLVALAVVTGTALSAMAASALASRHGMERQNEERALAIARGVALDPRFAQWVTQATPAPDGPVQAAAEQVRIRTEARYVVVTNASGVRYSHPNPTEVGRKVATDSTTPLVGHDIALLERGTLGPSARGKVPLRDAQGRIVGSVSVGIQINQVEALQQQFLLLLTGITGAMLVISLVVVALGSRRLLRITRHLESDEMADLLREHAALLGGAQEGVLAVDSTGCLRIANPAVEFLLGVPLRVGARIDQSGLPASVAGLLTDHSPAMPDGSLMVVGDRILQPRRLEVEQAGRDLGTVVVLSDRTDLDGLGRELEATRALTDALRAQAHEHTNRLHTLLGLLHLGHLDAALDYLADLTVAGAGSDGVGDPYLEGLLVAKTAVASERGVDLRISETTWVEGRLISPLDAVTVIGNLLDNAIRAAMTGERPAWVEVSMLCDGSDLVIHVVDSGPGVSPDAQQAMFRDGWTTKQGDKDRHGIGLSLARVTARRHGGYLELAAASGPNHGAAFQARLCDVMARPSLEMAGGID